MYNPADTALSHYLTEDDDTYFTRPSVEEGHTKACLASAIIAAVENWRDDEDVTDFGFALEAQSNFLHTATEYLDSELADCLCPRRRRVEKFTWTIQWRVKGEMIFDAQHCTLEEAMSYAEYHRSTWDGTSGWRVSRVLPDYAFFDTSVPFATSLDWQAE
jgi:hypothetical protein